MTSTTCNAISLHLTLTSLGAYALVHPLDAYRYIALLWKGALQTTINRCERLKRMLTFQEGQVSQASYSRVTFSNGMPLFIELSTFCFTERDSKCLVVENSSQKSKLKLKIILPNTTCHSVIKIPKSNCYYESVSLHSQLCSQIQIYINKFIGYHCFLILLHHSRYFMG